jgi:predicted Rossmann fold flavoprotein
LECSNGEKIFAKKVICAFGGSSGAGFMTDGSSYKLLTSLGHSLTKVTPSLVQIKTEREKLKGLKGIKVDALVSLYDDKRFVKSFEGDILFTDYGVSGNSIFAISAYLSEVKKPILKIEFLPTISVETLIDKITKKCDGKTEWEKVLVSVLPTRLIYAITRECNLSHVEIAKSAAVYNVVYAIKGFTLKVEGPAGFESSQVTSGGISTDDISSKDMQSKKISGLYVVGEALNVDGDCGGYNLQWAFTSAMIAAEGILNEKS